MTIDKLQCVASHQHNENQESKQVVRVTKYADIILSLAFWFSVIAGIRMTDP